MKRLIKKTIEFFKSENKLESKEVNETITLYNNKKEPEGNYYISRGCPNWLGLPSDHLEKGTRGGFLRYYEEDVEKMANMTEEEVIKYKRQLRKEGKYTIDDSSYKLCIPNDFEQNITPEWIDTLQENEIFVFGCRNSGRHFDGASNFALENFGAIMGQREGRQGQSYAIPTIGGVIGLKEIRQSVKTFTQYATEHPELHFLVTPIGCGGGCRRPSEIAPMFRDATKLPNVSLPQEFWDILNR